ncbi:MAG TPA: endonuclease MutS2 [Capsulimonadaceae bacterium]|jgi:DNA mismatch repair protein MutS2
MNDHSLRTLEYEAIREQLAGEASCSLGVEKALAMQPEDALFTVQRRLDETSEARKMLSIKGAIPLGGVSDIRPALRQASIGGSLEPDQLIDVAGTAGAARSLKSFLAKAEQAMWPLLTRYGSQLGTFQPLENEIGGAIAPNGSVLDSASPELARIRSRRRTAENRLREKLNAMISGPLRTYLQDPVIVQRADRACVPVKAEHRQAFGGIVHDTSSSGATLFIEPAAVVELGNEVREMEVRERQEVLRILLKLTDAVRRVEPELWGTVETLAEIDYIASRARLADRMNAVEPELNAQGITRLLSARHPLIDPERVVPIDIVIGEPQNRVLLITGPNTGGKTVTLKTLGLLTLMAQSGLHVPAARALIHVYNQVFSDIGDEQSIQQSLSTFSSHITNIARVLNEAGPNALVLFDEVGAGTDPGEGAALARALLQFLLRRNARVVATSHYGELKSFAYMTDGVQNASVEFDDVSLRPTYRLLQGVPGSSNAIAIAGRLGLPTEVLDEARELLAGQDNETADVIRSLEEAKRAAFSEAEAAQRARKEARGLREQAEQELSRYEQLRHEIRAKALAEAREIIRKAQEKSQRLVDDMKRKARSGDADRARSQARDELRDVEREVVDEIDELLALPKATLDDEVVAVPQRPLKAGDHVRVSTLGLTGIVLSDPVGGEKLPVQVGRLRVMATVADLLLIGTPVSSPPPPKASGGSVVAQSEGGGGESRMMEAAETSSQLTLLGFRADEAAMSLEGYLESAQAAGITRARIVHGKGTGTLRRVVHERLKAHPYVEDFADAGPEEGGAGATIVTLKG